MINLMVTVYYLVCLMKLSKLDLKDLKLQMDKLKFYSRMVNFMKEILSITFATVLVFIITKTETLMMASGKMIGELVVEEYISLIKVN